MATKTLGTTLKVCQTQNGTPDTVGSLRKVSQLKLTSQAIDVTTLASSDGREYIQGVRDCGELTLEGFFDKDNAGQTLLRTLYASGDKAYFTVEFPDQSEASFAAFVKEVGMGAFEVDAALGFSCVLRVTGGVSVT